MNIPQAALQKQLEKMGVPPPLQGDSTVSDDAKSMNKDEIEKHQRDTALLLNHLWDSLSQPKGGMHSPSRQARQAGGLSPGHPFSTLLRRKRHMATCKATVRTATASRANTAVSSMLC